MSETLRVVCAWCQVLMKDGPPEPVSHGICPECEKKLLEDYAATDYATTLTGV
jgi:hypothetical protein